MAQIYEKTNQHVEIVKNIVISYKGVTVNPTVPIKRSLMQ